MKLLRDAAPWPADLHGGAVAIGNFDGVHRGHADLIGRLRAQARAVGGPAVVLTFDPHPVRLLRPAEAPPPLTWTERKAVLLGALGVDGVLAYPTDLELLALEPRDFFRTIIVEGLRARALVEGANFRFGRDRQGDVQLLRTLCDAAGLALEVVEPLAVEGQVVSSSRVRQALSAGDVDLARRLLTEPYRLRGMVVHGAARGARLGFPTANVDAIDTLAPGLGVYGGRGHARGGVWPAAIHVGPNPTFGEHVRKIEAHLVGFSGTLYGEPIELEFLGRLRDTRPFAGVDALRQQLARDAAAAVALAGPARDPS